VIRSASADVMFVTRRSGYETANKVLVLCMRTYDVITAQCSVKTK